MPSSPSYPPAGGGNELPEILFADDFSEFSARHWHVEAEDPATQVSAENGQLLIDSPKGVTVWLRQPLQGAYRIDFQRQVLLAGGGNDRLSDLNQFWAAHDPHNADPFTRSGALEEYESLNLYYVGMGGNYNSTTRFRRYHSNGQRQILGEYTDTAHLLEANRSYRISIELDALGTRYRVDDRLFFEASHDGLPPPGHFGFRQVWARQAISDFRVVRL